MDTDTINADSMAVTANHDISTNNIEDMTPMIDINPTIAVTDVTFKDTSEFLKSYLGEETLVNILPYSIGLQAVYMGGNRHWLYNDLMITEEYALF